MTRMTRRMFGPELATPLARPLYNAAIRNWFRAPLEHHGSAGALDSADFADFEG